MLKSVAACAVALSLLAAAPAGAHEFGFAGLLSKSNRTDLAPITLGSGKPLAEAPYKLKSGGFYRIRIIADGSAEIAVGGADFFRAVWVDQIVINDVEIRPMGVYSLEFDDEGEAVMTFVAILPGRYELRVLRTRGDSLRALFIIE